MEFKVKGTSFENENGQSRQKNIQKVINTYIDNNYIEDYELYGGNTNKDIKELDLNVYIYEDISFPAKLKRSKYKDENYIEVYLIDYYKNEYKIGYVPKELVDTIWEYVNEEEIPVEITGGKYKKYDDFEDKVITNKVDSYGIKITFISDEEKEQIQMKQKERQKQIETEQKEKQKRKTNELTIELLICVFLGMVGGHKFYKRKTKEGFLYLFTFGLFGIGYIIDIMKLIIELIKIKAQ